MAKRVRGSVRPGQRRAVTRRPASATPAAAPRPSGLSEAELARAEELEAQLLAEERAAETARRRTVERASTTRDVAGTRTMAFEDEYAYVARDVKDIIRIASILFAILIVLWLVIDVFGIIQIG